MCSKMFDVTYHTQVTIFDQTKAHEELLPETMHMLSDLHCSFDLD